MRYDDREFESIYRQRYADVYWFFHRARCADEEAHDLTQEVFANVWKSWANYRRESVHNYLKKVALRVLLTRNRVRDALRHRGIEQSIDDPAAVIELITLPPDIDEIVQRRILYELIDRLPPITKECVLYWIDGYTYEQIARLVRISVEAVKTRLRDAKRMMKEDYDAQQK
ncbi:MAG TPA: sigma-70 family RNA polymerase sigma factor [Thermoanaerobaculia bacterium]|nr:sigma-70 family RNA polymerase sigma factor [Thermoanaerobaculia bacterium]